MTELTPFEQRLLGDLLDLHPTLTRRARHREIRRRVAVVTAAAAAIVAAPVAIDVLSPGYDPSVGVLSIAEAEGGVTVRVEDILADETAMTRQLREAGIPASVRTIPVSPFLVGRFIGVEAHGPRGQRVAMEAGRGRAEQVFVPNGVEPGLVLHVGRHPRPGEAPSAVVSPFHPEEIFACDADLLGADPATVERTLRARGVTHIEWSFIVDGVGTDDTRSRPDRGYLHSTNAIPGHDTAQVAISDSVAGTRRTLPPECPPG